MARAVAERLQALKWNAGMVSEFLGSYLSEPKQSVQFDEIAEISLKQYTKLAKAHGVVLAPASIALYDRANFFLNGEAYEPPPALAKWLRRLADQRQLTADEVVACAALPDLMDTFHDWAMEGWLQIAPAGV